MFEKSRKQRAAARRHRLIMAATRHIVSRHVIYGDVKQATPGLVVAYLFGQSGLRIGEAEAVDYLNAVLADRGYPLLASSTSAGEQQ